MSRPETHPAIEWALSGAMHLTGESDEAPRLAPGPLATWMRDTVERLRQLARAPLPADLDGPALLGERAALLALRRRGTVAPGGACRLLEAADGWIAATLARPDDAALLPAWLDIEGGEDPWPAVARAVRTRGAEETVARARLLGLAAAVAGPLSGEPAAAPPGGERPSPRARRGARRACSISHRSGRDRSARICSASRARGS